MALSPILAKLGTPAERSAQAMQRRTATSRLTELARVQSGYDDHAAALNASPHTGPDFSGYTNEHDYRNGLNRQGEIASLESELSGDGPARVQHTYAGTEFGMGPATQALQRRANAVTDDAPGDNLDFYGRQAQVQGAQAAADRQGQAAFEDWTKDDPWRVEERRANTAADIVSKGRAEGMGEAAGYNAPGQDVARRTKLWDDEARRKTLAPYDPAAIRAQGVLDAADVKGQYDLQGKQITGDSRTGSAAINALGRAAGAFTSTPEQDARVSGAMDTIRPNVPGQQAPAAAGRPFPRVRLREFAQQNGMTEQEAEQAITSRGYRIQ